MHTNSHSVAVIIPYFNGARWIERALRSVYRQTAPPTEVVVVNDGSRPEEREALGPLQARFGFVIVDQENGGQGSARNAGVAATTSNFIAFLDQDDFFLPQHIEVLVGGIPPNDPCFGWVYADLHEADEDGHIMTMNMLSPQYDRHPKRGAITEMLRHDWFILPSAALIARAAFEAVGGFDPQFVGYEDDDLFVRMFRGGHTNYFIREAVTIWCIRPASASFSLAMPQSRLKYLRKLSAMFPDQPHVGRFITRDILRPRFENVFLGAARDAVLVGGPDAVVLLTLLSEYVAFMCGHPSISPADKRRLKAKALVLTTLPEPVARFAWQAIASPRARRIRASLGRKLGWRL